MDLFNTGRLEFSSVDGRNPNDTDKFDKLYFFGGRGVSVFLASDMSLVWDSGSVAEISHQLLYPDLFNAGLMGIDNFAKQKPTDFKDQLSAGKVKETIFFSNNSLGVAVGVLPLRLYMYSLKHSEMLTFSISNVCTIFSPIDDIGLPSYL